MKKRALMALPNLTATDEMKKIATSDLPRKEKTDYIALFGLAFFGYKVVHDAPEHKNLCHNTPFCHWHYYLYKKVPAVFRP